VDVDGNINLSAD